MNKYVFFLLCITCAIAQGAEELTGSNEIRSYDRWHKRIKNIDKTLAQLNKQIAAILTKSKPAEFSTEERQQLEKLYQEREQLEKNKIVYQKALKKMSKGSLD